MADRSLTGTDRSCEEGQTRLQNHLHSHRVSITEIDCDRANLLTGNKDARLERRQVGRATIRAIDGDRELVLAVLLCALQQLPRQPAARAHDKNHLRLLRALFRCDIRDCERVGLARTERRERYEYVLARGPPTQDPPAQCHARGIATQGLDARLRVPDAEDEVEEEHTPETPEAVDSPDDPARPDVERKSAKQMSGTLHAVQE